jgi:hypothetical protein
LRKYSQSIHLSEFLLDLMNVLVENFNVKFNLTLSFDLHLVFGSAKLSILVLNTIFVRLHR